jgi:hypothetical protein
MMYIPEIIVMTVAIFGSNIISYPNSNNQYLPFITRTTQYGELMKTIFILIVISMILLSSSPSIADDDYVTFAKSLTADKYDQSLPSLPIEQWLTSVLPHGIVASWGRYVTDCGEQTGVPAIDKDRDMPLCAEIEFKENGRSVGYILLFIGTENKGISSVNAELYSGEMRRNDVSIKLNKLGDLKNIK